MLPANDSITPHFGRIRGRCAHRDAVVMHVNAKAQDGTLCGVAGAGRGGGGGGGGAGLNKAGGFWLIFAAGQVLGWRSMYVFMVSVFPFIGCLRRESHNFGSATRITGRNPRLLRRADTAFTFIASHIV